MCIVTVITNSMQHPSMRHARYSDVTRFLQQNIHFSRNALSICVADLYNK